SAARRSKATPTPSTTHDSTSWATRRLTPPSCVCQLEGVWDEDSRRCEDRLDPVGRDDRHAQSDGHGDAVGGPAIEADDTVTMPQLELRVEGPRSGQLHGLTLGQLAGKFYGELLLPPGDDQPENCYVIEGA